ncbi:MAG: M1 family metallopeptidase [Defluviitaleaceae bacterium]|nr:M1 family metallopeptidase [Defluviitaleaceae bacterium]
MRKYFMVFAIFLLVLIVSACGCGGEEIVSPPETNGFYYDYPPGVVESYSYDPEPPADIPEQDEHQVSLTINPDERTVSGRSHITFTNRTGNALETIVLRVYLNAFREGEQPVFPELEWRAFPNGRDFGGINIEDAYADYEPLTFELDGTILTLTLDEPLGPYETVRVFVIYNADIPEIAHRTGANEYVMWFGMFLPTLAVYNAEEGWNTDAHYPAGNPFYTETANYRVEITTPSRYVVVGTGVRTEELITDTDTRITRFTAYRARDFAFALSPYFLTAQTTTESGVDIHFYYHNGELDADEILHTARRAMEYFEERIGVLPFGHVTIVETELMQDSVSFSQVVFVDSWHLFRGGQYWGLVHALANQWLASVVGTNRVAEPWLTNGLTRFVQAGFFYPDETALRGRMERDYASINERTTLVLANGLGASQSWEHYVFAHGRKAMLMIYALHERVGEEVFWQIIAEYYRRHAFEIAGTEDFANIVEEISGQSMENFFSRWINEGIVPGLP